MKTLKLSDISKKYNDITVLANANAEFTSSKITCIRGQSGAGKTTLLNIIMGVEKTDKGIVEFGSSSSKSVGCCVIALASTTLCFSPPDNDKYERFLFSYIPTLFNALYAIL